MPLKSTPSVPALSFALSLKSSASGNGSPPVLLVLPVPSVVSSSPRYRYTGKPFMPSCSYISAIAPASSVLTMIAFELATAIE
uniref:Putative secreted peptide n=1 Tax=Anopheles braziliensis TaxID=58242 RepID=A0A2M3ZR91_9DIPT